jgi:beta-lactamase class D
MNLLLNAYEFWRYESKKVKFESLDENDNLRDVMLMSSSKNKRMTTTEIKKAAMSANKKRCANFTSSP